MEGGSVLLNGVSPNKRVHPLILKFFEISEMYFHEHLVEGQGLLDTAESFEKVNIAYTKNTPAAR